MLSISLPLHDSACSADIPDFLPPLISTGARGEVIWWPETTIPKYFKSTLWQGHRECFFTIQCQQQTDRGESYRKQETIISQQAKLLPQSEDTKFAFEIFKSRPYLFQTHCQRIADFLLEGQNTWWSIQGKNIVFHDGPSRPEQPLSPLQQFRSASMQDTATLLKEACQNCIRDFESGKIQLPLQKWNFWWEYPKNN